MEWQNAILVCTFFIKKSIGFVFIFFVRNSTCFLGELPIYICNQFLSTKLFVFCFPLYIFCLQIICQLHVLLVFSFYFIYGALYPSEILIVNVVTKTSFHLQFLYFLSYITKLINYQALIPSVSSVTNLTCLSLLFLIRLYLFVY